MSLNSTPSGERPHIVFLGCRNAGKSSLINAVTGQNLAIVSDVRGTTTDPVYKAMELLPAGPVMIVDTPGLDDEGDLGQLRIEKAYEALRKANLAVLVIDGKTGITDSDKMILNTITQRQLEHIIVVNKSDIMTGADSLDKEIGSAYKRKIITTSAITGEGIHELKEHIAEILKGDMPAGKLAGDLVETGDLVLLVIPIDKAAPRGRLILPQQQVIRDLLDKGAVPMEVRTSELSCVLEKFASQIRMVITDSQAFKEVSEQVPETIPLTSFSILFSRYKGELEIQQNGVAAIEELKDGDRVLISEGCTHHRQCGDIGRDKLPAIVRKLCGHEPEFVWTSGVEFPRDLSSFKAVIHCGGCMLNEQEMKSRIRMAVDAGVPITNYGMVIAAATGVLERSVRGVIT